MLSNEYTLPSYSVAMNNFTFRPETALDDWAEGSFTLSFNDFKGVAKVLVIDNEHINNLGVPNYESDDFESVYDQLNDIGFNYIDDAANYGIVEFDFESDTLGYRLEVDPIDLVYAIYFRYKGVAEGSDSFSIFVQLVSSSHEDENLNQYFDELPNELKWFRVHNTSIEVLPEEEPLPDIDDDDWTGDGDGSGTGDGDGGGIGEEDDEEGGVDTEDNYEPDPDLTLITSPVDILFHFIEQELKYDQSIDVPALEEARANHQNWRFDFVLTKREEGKKHIKNIVRFMKSSPTFNNNRLSWFHIKDTYKGDEPKTTISSIDIVNYKYSRTNIDDIKTSIELKYDYDIGLDTYKQTTGEINVNDTGSDYLENVYFITRPYGQMPDYDVTNPDHKINYYGLKEDGNALNHEDTKEIVECKYIRDPHTATEYAKFLLMNTCNVHNKISITLPLKYYFLEVGDLVDFDKMIKGRKLFNESYVIEKDADMPIRCGQFILPLFIITDIKKTLKDVKVELYQLHHLDPYTGPNYNGFQYEKITPMGFLPDIPDTPDYGDGGSGDLDGDGEVTVLDIVQLVQLIINSEYNATADLNNDGNVDVLDLVLTVQQIIG